MTSPTRPRSGPSPPGPSNRWTSRAAPPIEIPGSVVPAPTDRAQELDDQEEEHPQEGSWQDEERDDGRDDDADDAGSASDGIGQWDPEDDRQRHGDGEQSGHEAEQHADPPPPVGALDARGPQVRQPREADAHQAGRDEDHRRGRCRADDRRLGGAARGCQKHPQSGDARETRSERGFRDPFVVEAGRVRGSAQDGETEQDPGGVHAEHDGRLVEDMSRRRHPTAATSRRAPRHDDHGERGPVGLSAVVPRGPREAQPDQGGAGEGDEGQGAAGPLPARDSTVT